MPSVTPSQTVGPFYFGTLINGYRHDLAPPGVAGERIDVVLTLHDNQGAIVPDGLLEIWQANSAGRYNHPDDRRNLPLDPGFEGFGRASTYTDGCSHFSTIKPGRVNVWGTIMGVAILAIGISGIQQLGGDFYIEPLFNGVTLLIAIGLAGYAQRRRGSVTHTRTQQPHSPTPPTA